MNKLVLSILATVVAFAATATDSQARGSVIGSTPPVINASTGLTYVTTTAAAPGSNGVVPPANAAHLAAGLASAAPGSAAGASKAAAAYNSISVQNFNAVASYTFESESLIAGGNGGINGSSTGALQLNSTGSVWHGPAVTPGQMGTDSLFTSESLLLGAAPGVGNSLGPIGSPGIGNSQSVSPNPNATPVNSTAANGQFSITGIPSLDVMVTGIINRLNAAANPSAISAPANNACTSPQGARIAC